ncbi:MAG TPA: hypothetical protein ENL23_02570 [Candidatus Acetothermia bacterium]|nr:hypothetical protein [Candidatus Acetothermia bacterium]
MAGKEVIVAMLALFVKLRAKPGKRDEVKMLWEEHVKPHSESEDAVDISCYCYAAEEENTIWLFELLSSPSVAKKAMQSEWFAAYQNAIGPLLMAPPKINTATPVWVKHLQG